MTDILARLQNPDSDPLVKEREGERKWRWVLLRFKPSHLLSDASLVRTIASHWGRFVRQFSIQPSAFQFQDLPQIAALFTEYLDDKKRSFLDSDIWAFIAWKIWEAKVSGGGVIVSGEIWGDALRWSAALNYETEAYKALSRIERRRDDNVIEAIANSLNVHEITPEQKEKIKEILGQERAEFFDAIRDTIKAAINQVLGDKLPGLPGGDELNQIEGSEEAA